MTSDSGRLVEALTKCAERFREYEAGHQQKADDYARSYDHKRIAQGYIDKAARNREMAEMCEAVIAEAREALQAPIEDGPFTFGPCSVNTENDCDGAAVFEPDGQPFCLIDSDTVIGGDPLPRAQMIAALLNAASEKAKVFNLGEYPDNVADCHSMLRLVEAALDHANQRLAAVDLLMTPTIAPPPPPPLGRVEITDPEELKRFDLHLSAEAQQKIARIEKAQRAAAANIRDVVLGAPPPPLGERAREVLVALVEARKAHIAAVDAYNARLSAEKLADHWPPRMDDLYQKMSDAERVYRRAVQSATDEGAIDAITSALSEREAWRPIERNAVLEEAALVADEWARKGKETARRSYRNPFQGLAEQDYDAMGDECMVAAQEIEAFAAHLRSLKLPDPPERLKEAPQ